MKQKRPTPRRSYEPKGIPHLDDIPNVGPAVATDLRRLGIMTPAELLGRDPYASMTTCAGSLANATIRACSTRSSPLFDSWRAHRRGRGGHIEEISCKDAKAQSKQEEDNTNHLGLTCFAPLRLCVRS
jgi:hypothetical protein